MTCSPAPIRRTALVAALAALCVAGGLAGPASPSVAAPQPRTCPDLVLRKQSDDRFYDIRTRRIGCRAARAVLRRYRRHGRSCIPGWRCAYGLEPAWALEPRVRLTRKRQQIYFGIAG